MFIVYRLREGFEMRAKFGTVKLLPSGRWHASYSHPTVPNPAVKNGRWNATETFETKVAAERFLRRVKDEIDDGIWAPPAAAKVWTGVASEGMPSQGVPTLRTYSERWLAKRKGKSGEPLRPKSVRQYQLLLNQEILPALGELRIDQINKPMVRAWHERPEVAVHMRSQSYQLLKTILKSAIEEDDLIEVNPCQIRGAGTALKAKEKEALSTAQIEALIATAGDRYKALIAVLGYSGLRFAEMASLAPGDVNFETKNLRIRTSKTDAGIRLAPIFPEYIELLRTHLEHHAGRDLVFANREGKPLHHGSIQYVIRDAAAKAGIEGHIHPHLLRHSAATNYARRKDVNASDVARFLGHTTAKMAMHYMHSTDDRLVELAGWDV